MCEQKDSRTTKVIDLFVWLKKKEDERQKEFVACVDLMIIDALQRGVCEHCGSFMDNPYHEEPCKLKKEKEQSHEEKIVC